MPNIRTKRFWDLAWERISRIVTPGAGSAGAATVESPFGAGPLTIEEPLTLYVETTGNDNNDGGFNAPFRTIQAAIESLRGLEIRNNLTVQVGVGSFAAFSLPALNFRTDLNPSSPVSPGQALQVNISGTMVTPSIPTGTTAGTLTSATTIVNKRSVVTDSTQSWTPGSLVGLFFVGSTPNFTEPVPIIANTATTLTVVNTVIHTGTYTIVDCGTIIDSGESNTIAGANNAARITVEGAAGTAASSIVIRNLRVVPDSVAARCFNIRNSRCEIRSVVASNTSLQYTFLQATACIMSVFNSFATRTGSPLGTGISCLGTQLALNGSYLGNFVSGISFANTLSTNALTTAVGVTVENCTTGLVLTPGHYVSTSMSFTNCTTGISSSLFNNNCTFRGQTTTGFGMLFTNCGTCVSLEGMKDVNLFHVEGTGNTNGIVLTKGARCQISNTATLGATTELSVDGVTGTLATLRANSPRVFPVVPNAYGTYVYE